MTNIALIVLDTLRFDAFQRHFDWLPGTNYTNAWSTSHRTPPVHASLFTGNYGSQVGVLPEANTLDTDAPVLAEQLREHGYRTRGYSANPYITEHFNFDRGFTDFSTTWDLSRLADDIFDWEQFANDVVDQGWSRYLRGVIHCIRSDSSTMKSLKWGLVLKLQEVGVDFGPRDDGAKEVTDYVEEAEFGDKEFLFLNLMEAHEPYYVPETSRVGPNRILPSSVELTMYQHDWSAKEIRRRYTKACEYLASCYRRVFELLQNDFDLIITCSDHGELFGKDGIWGHFHGVYPELTHVPLHVYSDDTDDEERADKRSLLDVYPTIMRASGVTDFECFGQPLDQPPSTPRNDYTECHGISSDRLGQLGKKIPMKRNPETFEHALFGVITSEGYVYETINGARTTGEVDEEESDILLSEAKSKLQSEVGSRPMEVSDQVRRRLGDLGYV